MIAYRFDDFKSLGSLRAREEEMPQAQRGEILIRVRAVSLNYRDLAMVLGRYVSDTKTGLIPTSDATGEVVAVGEGVDSYKVGDRVILRKLCTNSDSLCASAQRSSEPAKWRLASLCKIGPLS